MGFFKNLIKKEVGKTISPASEQVEHSTVPDWSHTRFDKNISPTPLNERRKFISQKFTDLVAMYDEDPKQDSSTPDIKNTEDSATHNKAEQKKDEPELEEEQFYDPSDANQIFFKPETGELVSQTLNQIPQDQVVKQAVNDYNNKQIDEKNLAKSSDHVSAPANEKVKRQPTTDRMTSSKEKAKPKVRPVREEYRRQQEKQERISKKNSNNYSAESTKPSKNMEVSDKDLENINSLESLAPMDELLNVQPPVDLPLSQEASVQQPNSVQSQSANSTIAKNIDYQPMKKLDKKEKELFQNCQKQLIKGWKEYKAKSKTV